ncbi:MAG TPA: hypothetical protein VM841_10875 [Actinomycetota bacterium]|nr:hypothetical protein [Actinomycetota bacterium]
MARYYVYIDLSPSEGYVLGATLREPWDDGAFRETSLAAAIAGQEARIYTDEEMWDDPSRRAALAQWFAERDDSVDDIGVARPSLRLLTAPLDTRTIAERSRAAIAEARRAVREASKRREEARQVRERRTPRPTQPERSA